MITAKYGLYAWLLLNIKKKVFFRVSNLIKAHIFHVLFGSWKFLVFQTDKYSFRAVEKHYVLSCICSEILLDSKACVEWLFSKTELSITSFFLSLP